MPVYLQQLRSGYVSMPRMAVIIQEMIEGDVSGVAFSVNPITRQDEVVITANWGHCDAVVSGRGAVDQFNCRANGQVEQFIGNKEHISACFINFDCIVLLHGQCGIFKMYIGAIERACFGLRQSKKGSRRC